MKQVIVEADDFGLTPAISHTILQLEAQGVVTATNCMPTMPGILDSLHQAEAAGATKMGIHLIIDRHLPASSPDQIASLVAEDGHLLPFDVFASRLAIGEINLGELASELAAQIELAQRLGFKLDHLTTHKNFELLSPAVFKVVTQLAVKTGLPLRHNLTPGQQTAQWQLLKQAKLAAPTQTLALHHETQDLKAVDQALAALPAGGTLALITHPGVPSALLTQRSSLTAKRAGDRDWLVGPWQDYLAQHADLQPVDYARV